MKLDNLNFEFPAKIQKLCIVAIIIGLVSVGCSMYFDATRSWINILVNNVYFVSLGAIALFFLALGGVVQASWIAPYRRVPEAMTKFLPIGLLLMLALYFGIHTLYEWSHPEVMANDTLLMKKIAFLNEKFFMIRLVSYFAAWILFSKILVGLSRKHDTETSDLINHKTLKYSAIGMVFFALSYSMAGFDWIMTLEPHWFSTIFALYVFAGGFVTAIAFMTLAIIFLKKNGYLNDIITDDHYHDLGKFLFGFSTFWAYIWLSQYLLIWYSNIPEETEYYILRTTKGWSALFYINLVINWVIPFFVLMSRKAKRCPNTLVKVSLLLLVGRWIDLYLMSAPKVLEHANIHHPSIGLTELGIFIGYIGLFVLVFGKALTKAPLVAKNDPYLAEGCHLHQ